MGFISDSANRIREYFRNDKEALPIRMAKGATSAAYPSAGYDMLQAYGYDVLSDYLKLEHDLLSRYVDYEEMDEYPELSTALDIFADDSTQVDIQTNRTVWVESKDENVERLLSNLLHKTLRLDEEIWTIARTLCIKQGSLVWTSKGPKAIETVEPGDLVQSYKDGKPVLCPVVRRMDNGTKEVWRVRTKHRELFATADHRILVEGDGGAVAWVAIQDLKLRRFDSGHIDTKNTSSIVTSRRAPSSESVRSWASLGVDVTALQRTEGKGSPHALNLPERITPEFCRLYGFLLGDGFASSSNTESTNMSVYYSRGVYPELNEFYDSALRDLGLNPTIQENAQRTAVASIHFRQLLESLGWVNGASKKCVPAWLGSLPEDHRAAFLQGFMDADGWESQQKTWTRPAKHFEIANVEMTRQLKAVIDGLGYRSGNIRVRTRAPGFKISGKTVKTTQPTGMLTFSDHQYNHGFEAENVLSVEKYGEFPVYDLEIGDDCHNFVVDGVVVHNCKYGNDFEELLITDNGVEGLNFLSPPTTRRIEGPRGELFGFLQDFKGKVGHSPAEFQQILANRAAMMRGNGAIKPGLDRTTAFEDWEVVHFRMQGKQRRSVYGHSALESARWIWKRLMMLEDAAMIYRLQRAPERYAFYVDVGDMPPAEAMAYVNRVKQTHKKSKFFDPTSGKMNLKFNPLPVSCLTPIPLLDGRTITIKQMAEEHDAGVKHWVHSIDRETGKPVSGEVSWVGKTRDLAATVRISFDDGTYAETAPDHPVMLRTRAYRNAGDLAVGDIVMRRVTDLPSGAVSVTSKRYQNLRVAAVALAKPTDQYCMTVEIWHNFALRNFNFDGSISSTSEVYVKNSQDEDFFIPSREGKDGTRIDVLGAPAWQSVDDLNYFREQLYAAIKVPKAFMGQEDGVARAVLSSQDVRFARTILRVQRELRNGIAKICRTHLAAINIDPTNVDFEVRMTVPSSIFELAQMEVRNARADLASKMGEFVSLHWTLQNVFGFSDADIEKIIEQRETDSTRLAVNQIKAEVAAQKYQAENAPPPPMPPGADGAPSPDGAAPPTDPNADAGTTTIQPDGTVIPPPEAGLPALGGPTAVDRPSRIHRLTGYREKNFPLMQSRYGVLGARITEKELFEGKSKENSDRATEKLSELLKNDKMMVARLMELRSLLDAIKSSKH